MTENLDRPACLTRDACTAKSPGKHCKVCAAKAAARAPGAAERRGAATRARFRDPAVRAKHRQAIIDRHQAQIDDPVYMEKRRESGRRLQREILSKPEVRAKTYSFEVRSRASRKAAAKRLSWLPLEYRSTYLELVMRHRIKAVDARRMVEDQIERDRREYCRTGQLQASQRERQP